jgi:hypothetical protein
MSTPPGWPGLRASLPALSPGLSLLRRCRTPDRPAWSSSAGGDPAQENKAGWWPLWRSAEGLAYVFHHLLGILVKHGIVLHDQEAVVVLFKDGHELVDGEGAAHFQFCEIAVQPIEDARVVAADEEDLVALQFKVAIEGAGQQLHGGDEEAVGLWEQGDGGEEFDIHDKRRMALGI